jgi:hypothetical protein
LDKHSNDINNSSLAKLRASARAMIGIWPFTSYQVSKCAFTWCWHCYCIELNCIAIAIVLICIEFTIYILTSWWCDDELNCVSYNHALNCFNVIFESLRLRALLYSFTHWIVYSCSMNCIERLLWINLLGVQIKKQKQSNNQTNKQTSQHNELISISFIHLINAFDM